MAHEELQHGMTRLSAMRDFRVADNDPDPRGWQVVTEEGTKIGRVRDLIVDRAALKVHYLEVELDPAYQEPNVESRVLVPADFAQLSTENKRLLLSGVTREALCNLGWSGGDEWSASRERRGRRQPARRIASEALPIAASEGHRRNEPPEPSRARARTAD